MAESINLTLAAFDPLHPTDMQRLDMVRGYRDGRMGGPWPDDASPAYCHGRKVGFNTSHGESDKEMTDLAARAREEWLGGRFGRSMNILHAIKQARGG